MYWALASEDTLLLAGQRSDASKELDKLASIVFNVEKMGIVCSSWRELEVSKYTAKLHEDADQLMIKIATIQSECEEEMKKDWGWTSRHVMDSYNDLSENYNIISKAFAFIIIV